MDPDVAFPVSVDASEFGESTYPNALPWTRIAAASFDRYENFTPMLEYLKVRHRVRSAKDVEYQWWVEDVRQFREEQAKKSISLNEAARRAERDKFDTQRTFRNEERKRLGIEFDPLLAPRSDDGLQADERNVAESVAREEAAKKFTDPLLRESAAILSDLIGALIKDGKVAAHE